jgi:uncharacterized phage protein gp47/JayE
VAVTPEAIFATETDEEIYARLLADLGDPPGSAVPWNTRPGSVIHAILQPILLERRRLLDYAEFVVQLGFLQFATGSYLDAKAAEFGVVRSAATPATVTLTFEGEVGTFIDAGTVVSTESDPSTNTPGISFFTNEAVNIGIDGDVDVLATAETGGSQTNVGIHELVILVTSVPGVSSVNNHVPAAGGLDAEDDETLRQKALARAGSFPAGGNKSFYETLALQDPEVGAVYVEDLWLGPGTGRVVVGGIDDPWVSPTGVERLQERIDPTVKFLAHFELENWTGGTEITSGPLEGQASRSLAATNPTAAIMELDKDLALGAWDDPADEVWIGIRRITDATTIGNLKVIFYAPGGMAEAYAQATVAAVDLNAVAGISTSAGGRLVVEQGDFIVTNGTGTFNWNNIGGIRFELNAAAGQTAQVWLDGMRITRKFGGFDTGEALIGIQITVRSARAHEIDVSANLQIEPTLTLSDVEADIQAGMEDLLEQKAPGSIIRLSEVANVIHDTPGVIDYDTLLVNGLAANFQLEADQRAVVGTLSFTLV